MQGRRTIIAMYVILWPNKRSRPKWHRHRDKIVWYVMPVRRYSAIVPVAALSQSACGTSETLLTDAAVLCFEVGGLTYLAMQARLHKRSKKNEA